MSKQTELRMITILSRFSRCFFNIAYECVWFFHQVQFIVCWRYVRSGSYRAENKITNWLWERKKINWVEILKKYKKHSFSHWRKKNNNNNVWKNVPLRMSWGWIKGIFETRRIFLRDWEETLIEGIWKNSSNNTKIKD